MKAKNNTPPHRPEPQPSPLCWVEEQLSRSGSPPDPLPSDNRFPGFGLHSSVLCCGVYLLLHLILEPPIQSAAHVPLVPCFLSLHGPESREAL
ncbi:uncharacterized protein LOC125723083 isoform X2 [Brienomyrus brachyistius]|uniref:uncharacterized protein LOC125723083 isoform X2 n=1 Tax=Brienomyrus brachyistius TaxID=42636 RepID=UPI0020B40F47|nr:uncharacterized protein LOC125723083 isoform X2 [Brienomyrus brachyistius]